MGFRQQRSPAATRLQKLGYSNVRHYPGGKDKWRDLGLPLERAGRPFVPK